MLPAKLRLPLSRSEAQTPHVEAGFMREREYRRGAVDLGGGRPLLSDRSLGTTLREGVTLTRTDLHRLTGTVGGPECEDDDCPNVYLDHVQDEIVIQGERCGVFQPPEGEVLVRIPASVLREAVRALGW